jgi:hypothetical protein
VAEPALGARRYLGVEADESLAQQCGVEEVASAWIAVGQQGARPTGAPPLRCSGRLDTSGESQLLRWKRDPARSQIRGEVRRGERNGEVDPTVLRCPGEVSVVGR